MSAQWEEIIGAKVVDIRTTKGKVRDTKRLSRYCVSQYCSGQREFVRYSWSWGWVFKEFVRVWKWLIRNWEYEEGLWIWDSIMEGLWKEGNWKKLLCRYTHEVSIRVRVFHL